MPDDRIKIGISACLLGEKVRYDGGHKFDRFLADTLGPFVQFVPVCPEVGCGLPVPREPMQLEGDPDSPRLITISTRIDHTDRMLEWAGKRLVGLSEEGISGFVLKARSPSCGIRGVLVYAGAGVTAGAAPGIFARALMERFPHLPVEDEEGIHDPALRESFIERIFAYGGRKRTF